MSSSKHSKTLTSSSSSSSSRKLTFFVPGDGIDREVISTDICRYLGNDATTRPGDYTDTNTGELTRGYFITAYRALTTEQLADIKADSLRWNAEKKQPAGSSNVRQPLASIASREVEARMPDSGTIDYRQSTTRKQQQQWVEAPPRDTYSVPLDRRIPAQEERRTPSDSGLSRAYEPPPPQRVQPQLSNSYLGQSYSEVEAIMPDTRAPPPYPSNTGLSRTAHPAVSRNQPISYSNYPPAAAPLAPQYGYSSAPSASNMPIVPSAYPPQQLRNISPQYTSMNAHDVDMYDAPESSYGRQEPPPINYRTPPSRQELPQDYRAPAQRDQEPPSRREEFRRDDRSERHRDNRRRH